MEAKNLELSDTPYPGLRPFRADEADIFFGRERQTDDLLARLAAHRFLAVVGPSGCGKSSLVAAGLMPALATGFMATAGAHWRIAKLRPGERPMANLAAALVEARILDDERAAQPDAPVFLEAALRRGPLGLVEILRGAALAPDANLLVLVDQFEELFRFSAGVRRDEAEAFVALLLASAAAPRERIYIAITMRSDFLGECAPFHGLPEAINDGLYLTPRLTRDECAACITGPARVFGADVEPALVNRLLNDFGPDPDQLPLLQHALLRMWNLHDPDRRSGAAPVLTVADYDAIGGLARSLSNHADEAFGELDPDHQRIAKLMFQRLSDSETARRDRRAPAHAREIAELAGASIDDVRRVADVFRRCDRCFLVPREGIELMPDTLLDISHESLLRQWDRAARWIEEEADTVAAYRRLREAARAWQDGEALLAGPSLDRALAWRGNTTAMWARRYGPDDDFQVVCDLIATSQRERGSDDDFRVASDFIASQRARDAKRLQQIRARSMRLRRSIAAAMVGALALTGLIAWPIWPLLYAWEHTSYYASHTHLRGEPLGIGKLTSEQRRHRPVSYRVVTAGLLGRNIRMEAVNNDDELTEVDPEYNGAQHGRQLRISRWRFEYDVDGKIAAEYQYTSRDELVLGKVYVPLSTPDERLAIFVGPDGTPVPVHGRSENSTYYWAERLRYQKLTDGDQETTSYLGPSGEAVRGGDRAFAQRLVHDGRGHTVSITSLDASGQPMNDTAGNSTLMIKTDDFGNELEVHSLDKQGHPTHVVDGYAIYRAVHDAHGNQLEQAFFDENDRPIITNSGWHKQRMVLDEHGSVVETRYFDQDDKPTFDAQLSCYGSKERHDAMNRLTRWTCLDATGAPNRNRNGFVTSTWRFDGRGRLVEETTLDAGDHLTAASDAVATKLYGYDSTGRLAEVSCRGADGEPVTNGDGYSRSVTRYDDASHIESTRFLGVDGEPISVKEGYASLKRKRDIWWNITEEHYYDEHGAPTVTNNGAAGWRSTFNATGNEIERVLLGKADETVLGKDGYAGWRAQYDGLGLKIAMHYLDVMGNPVVNVADGVAGWSARYDAWGHQVALAYFGLEDQPIHSTHGEAGWRAEYDGRGNQISLQYVDTRGAPTLHAWKSDGNFTGTGYALLTQAFDARGLLEEEAYFGVRKERVARPGSWSYAKYVRDVLGHPTRMSYFGAQDEPVKFNGYHTVTWKYDDRGNAVQVRYFDMDDKTPIVSNQGFARMEWAYDQDRNVVDERVFGTHDERVAASDGAHHTIITRDSHGRKTRMDNWGPEEPPNKLGAIEFRYDGRGNTTEERHLDALDHPLMALGSGCATRRWRYSDRQELLEEMCLGPGAALVPLLDNGAARIVYSYGRPGETVKEMYFDPHGRPFTTKQGFAGIKYKSDLLGRVTEMTYVNAEQAQVFTTIGYARVAYAYDAHGDINERAYFLANDSPLIPVAKMVSEFDALRRRVKDRYLGPGAKPALLGAHHGPGQHVTLYDYDDYGNVHALHYLDARGRPTRGYARMFDESWQSCGRWVAQYDEDGKLVGNGECQQALPIEEPHAPGGVRTAARGAM